VYTITDSLDLYIVHHVIVYIYDELTSSSFFFFFFVHSFTAINAYIYN
jgi:hypothetical protein